MAAEFAVTLPALLLVLGAGIAALLAGGQLVRMQDAAADAARLISRGEDSGYAESIARAAGGESIVVQREGELVCVIVRGGVRISGVASIPLSARSCALGEGR